MAFPINGYSPLEGLLGGRGGGGGQGPQFGYKPREENILQALLFGLNQGMSPQDAFGVYQGVYGGALDRLQTQRAQQQVNQQTRSDALSGLGSQVTEAALGGVPAAGLEALVGVQQAANPILQRPAAAGALDQIVSSGGTLAGSVPGGAGDPETLQALVTQVDESVDLNVTGGEGAGGFYDTLAALRSQWQVLGIDAETIRKLRDYFALKWTERGGRGAPGATAVPAPSGGALDIGLNASNTRWQDAFGLFPNLFG